MVRCKTLFVCFLGIAFVARPSEAKFGFRRSSEVLTEDLVEEHVHSKPEELSPLTEQEAIDVAELLHKAKNDPQTLKLVALMKKDNPQEVATLGKEMSRDDVMSVLKQTMNEIKKLDVLFEDPERALRVMQDEGIIDKRRLKEYQKDPALLEEDTRRAYYYQFVAIAVAGDYL